MPAPRRRAVNTAAQGRELEWAVMSALRSGGWTPMRSAGSKGAVDVIGIPGRYVNPWVLVQCKLTNPVLPPAERSALFGMAQLSASVPVVASRGDKGRGLRVQYRDDRAMGDLPQADWARPERLAGVDAPYEHTP